MKFWQAMRLLEKGLTITPCSIFLPTNIATLKGSMECSALTYWAEEWEVAEEDTPKTYTFTEVLEGLKNGRIFRRPHWGPGLYLDAFYYKNEQEKRIACPYMHFQLSDFEATDWIEVKE